MFQSVDLPAFMNDDSQLLVLLVCIMMILSSLAFGWKRKDSQYSWLLKKMKLNTLMAIFTKANVAVLNNCYKYILHIF